MEHLTGVAGVVAGARFALVQTVTVIGREQTNDIVIADETVLPFHARFERRPDGTVIADAVDGTGAVTVNDSPVNHAVLAAGDEIAIGDNIFRFDPE